MIPVAQDFIYWMDRAVAGGWVLNPEQYAREAITAKALEAKVAHGRITLWLWMADNQVKGTFAMARIGGDGAERPVVRIYGAPPVRDDDKAQICFQGERL